MASSGRNPSSSKDTEPELSKVSVICVEDQTALRTPVRINGVKFPRCIIDAGAEVNLIFVKGAIMHRFPYEVGGIQAIKGLTNALARRTR